MGAQETVLPSPPFYGHSNADARDSLPHGSRFLPFGAKKATTPKMNPPAMTSEQTAPSTSIPTGLPLRARRPNRYTAMPKQGARRLNNAARAMNEVG